MWDKQFIIEDSSRRDLVYVYVRDLEIVIRFYRLDDFYAFCHWMENRWVRIKNLLMFYLEYDLPRFVSTHASMDRRIARLKKLLKILENENITPWIDIGDNYFLNNSTIFFRKILDHLDFSDILSILDAYRNEFHRVRDKVHQYLYPILKRNLEHFWTLKGIYAKRDVELEISSALLSSEPEYHIKSKKHSDYLKKKQFYEILNKMIYRSKKKIKHNFELAEFLHVCVKFPGEETKWKQGKHH